MSFLPAAPETVALYLVALSQTHRPATLTGRLTSIARAHEASKLPSPAELESAERGLQLRETHGGWRVETKPLHASLIASIRAERGERPLSAQALEALAVVALRQPIATEEVSAIRALDSGAKLETFRKRKLIVAKRSRGAGKRPAWRTTDNFLDLFGL